MKHLFATALTTAMLVASGAWADDTILTVTKDGQDIALTMEEIKAMPVTRFDTATQWTEGGAITFTGVSLADFVAHFEVSEGIMGAIAINDYKVEIPVSDAVEGGPIIAYEMNGAAMSRRDKGPLWVVYPFDDNPEYQSETHYSRAIWQLDRVTFD
ncbi:molybdopterin-dependent oxidoreductase [Celeribacter persicus]|jgi:Uncharacterized protein conserved in bacteria|uniref:Oxidoreductase molybdopterin-binding domain-containing protein n=1 Tax=Celeribacter persicus TaxID=1651082 RepID=A0A2T5H9X4_9RHOB|nr:molybdopterin-dependent oxidoreductase [Celeribacter persicus]PTQ68342.1 hypothetical protein C8N42_11554 [Celeribacter persicus]